MTTETAAEREQRDLRSLRKSLSAVDGWLDFSSRSDWATVASGSPLAGDDKKVDPFHVSHAAASAIHVAVEHADAFRRLIEGCQTCNPNQMTLGLNSNYSLLRGALENARAVWLLSPDVRPDRLLRRLRLQVDNVANSENVAQAMASPMAKPREVRLDRVREIADRAGLDGAAAVKRVRNLEIIRTVGEFVGGSDAGPHAEVLWRACSGAAHGDIWAGLSLHDKDTVSQRGNLKTLAMTASTGLLTTMTAETFAVVNAAHLLFDRRRRPPY